MADKRRKAVNGQPPPVPDATARDDSSLSRDRIAAAAVELLDAEGAAGLTMRRLAERLGSGVMSLYWHVANKEEVFGLALDSVLEYRRPARPSGPRDWRGEIAHMLADWRAVMLRHPWSASLLPRQALGCNILDRMELLGETLSGLGVPEEDLNAAIWALWNYVMGATVTRASFDNARRGGAHPGPSGDGRHPTIERSGLLLDDDWDGVFRKGLGFLLDGLVSGRPRSGRP